jgi:type III restriction enzyme
MNRHVNAIAGRLSLRPPQRDSLEILARVAEVVPLGKDQDVTSALATIRSEFPNVTDFERAFPSLCFALATGVGKTRLMGAFVTYLYLARGVRHFFVLAPNLTIYEKLIRDFTPNTPKYVLQGIAEFATNPPEIITGENYESGRGVRHENWLVGSDVHVNIFNISKINSEVRGGSAPRIRRLSEYIGQSYFDYLAGLDDLVLLMDESHRYRASAGVRAINELKPILGLELTATPQIEMGGRSEPFKNVIYAYPLATAITDGFVKEPAVATRENFDKANYTDDELELLKLEDGVRIHEHTKIELEVFARQAGKPIVKPFMLVVAQDTDHADALVERIRGDEFFEGRYKNRVITVHSALRGEEKDDTVQRLLAVEDPDEPTEIVVHVNMLKEGWDVTNLYTIVPLRAANSRTLVEQSIGRGLRLPFRRRTGVAAVDRLTIVSHDRFQEIVDEANRPDSIIRAGVVIGRDIPIERRQIVTVRPAAEAIIEGPGTADGVQQTIVFETAAEKAIARLTLEAIRNHERLPSSQALYGPQVQAALVRAVETAYRAQATLGDLMEAVDIAANVAKATQVHEAHTIDIPRIVVVPRGEVRAGFHDFDLDPGSIRLQPVDKDILIQLLRTNEREKLVSGDGVVGECRLEDYIVRSLIDFDDVCYDEHADLLYKLAGQLVAHLRSYLPNEEAAENVLQFHQRKLGEFIHSQMEAHAYEEAAGFEARVSKGFVSLHETQTATLAGESVRPLREPIPPGKDIRSLAFGGFKRCVYEIQKFDSEPERLFAIVLESDPAVLKWVKPLPGLVRIDYRHGLGYEPDFVVETTDEKLLCEVKRASEMDDPEVREKAAAGVTFCVHASNHARENDGRPWRYLLIPHDAVTIAATLDALAKRYTVSADPPP